MTGGVVCCGQVMASCSCVEQVGHEGPHVCTCGGSWHYTADGEFWADSYPQIPAMSLFNLADVLTGGW